jgi:hypothetical protein
MRGRALALVLWVAACGNGTAHPPLAGSESVAGAGGDSGAKPQPDESFGPEKRDCTNAAQGDLAGCSCSAGGSRACFTVDPSSRNSDGCKDGNQLCEHHGEFWTWGACTGEDTSCQSNVLQTPSGPGCCVPGAQRWCDTIERCDWGQQQCKPDGTWGPCAETGQRAPGCSGPYYDRDCCVRSGACCQEIYATHTGATSVGKCDGIACPGDVAR